ncbi:methyl-accepting chemotaxis protein [Curvibacter sp. HBC28]|uniref:Methyl-accepting chemotaxis protein n=1 Tax=Curvibacter microcysteis TaxID=3026419 RepID=A0ABT5ML23_9BURK|nr:methyl-accepting chemotaxis protein [Curvibacter sp. HBC28]MDD0817086.1 methyl-accepting chemotaxis protein [Curvibacter sp. HBC28]
MSMHLVSVRAKLSAAFGGLTVLVLIVSGLAIIELQAANQAFKSYVNGINTRATLAASIQAQVDARAIAARNLVLVTKPADVEVEKAAVAKAHEQVQKNLAKLKEMVALPDVPAQAKALVDDISKIEQAYSPVALSIVQLALQNKRDEAIAKMNEECRPLLMALVGKTNAYAELTAQRSALLIKGAEEQHSNQRTWLVAACLIAVVAAVVAGMLIVRSLTRALGAEPGVLGQAAEKVAGGDLSPVLGADSAPAGSVLASLGTMQQSLVRIVGQVRGAADSIATGTSEISVGNADLSQRTENQASALEETAATMEQFGTTVRHNADNARLANQLALNASEVASKGGTVVAQVVETMKGINDSSKKIGDIIGVIDGIAFQTNILALNAAVEAARAGEQGRGFAVVASEVRSLAGRSAEAAKEIKSLIGASVDQVEQGTVLVDQAGQTMEEVVAAITRVSDIVGEISSASSEQSSGVTQIGEAINQLDQTTQQNAALVEESAAAAQSLEHQSAQLVTAMAVFKLSGEAHRSAQAQPKKPLPRPHVFKAAAKPKSSLKSAKAAPELPLAKPPASALTSSAKAGAEDQWESF